MSDEVTEYACNSCGHSNTDRDEFTELNEQLYCNDCSIQCGRCYERIGLDGNYIDDHSESWCDDCSSNYSNWCDSCDSRYSDDVSFYDISDRNRSVCEHCASNSYCWCDDHEVYYYEYCDVCGSDDEPELINSYGYKPDPVFYGSDPRGLYFGIEVETEIWSRDLNSPAQLAQGQESFYLKQDSSIGHNSPYSGFEIVSHPHTLDSWMALDNPMLSYLEQIRDQHQARSWDAKSSCGLHIHISRDGFGSGAHTHRFLSLIYSNAVEMSKMGGRKGSNYAKFSDVYKFDDYGRPYRDFRDKIHQRGSTERYSAVNTNNRNTLELRWFQGTLKRDGILANIQLAHAMVEYTRYLTVAQVREGALRWDRFAHWVASVGTYPQLAEKIERIESISLSVKPLLNA